MTEKQTTTRRVSVNVDAAMLHEASALLGTATITETINRSLDEAIQLRRRQQLLDHDFDLTLEQLLELRKTRTF